MSLKEALDAAFPDKIEYYPVKDIGTTGNFEITILQTGKLVHSKRMGLGRCESDAERQRLFKILKVFVDYLDAKTK